MQTQLIAAPSLYYLDNFEKALAWISSRYDDILNSDERLFIADFGLLPNASKALLVRLLMRKGEQFRTGKLRYPEIGDIREAGAPLVALGWIDPQPLLTLDQLFGLLVKAEIAELFNLGAQQRAAKKSEQLEALRVEFTDARSFADWCPDSADSVYQLCVRELSTRFRLLFFGNPYQDWTEFVLSDLGIFNYEKVEFPASSRGFQTRQDVDDYFQLHRCRESLHGGESPDLILAKLPASVFENAWLESRREKFLYQIAQRYEQMRDWPNALKIYSQCNCAGSRIRTIRVLERCGHIAAACELAETAQGLPENEAEKQQLMRLLPRLRRKSGSKHAVEFETASSANSSPIATRISLKLSQADAPYSVEELVREHLQVLHSGEDSRSFYVENTLINSLFGLLCWKAIFAPIPGAFFHPFQSGPADLHSAEFNRRREAEFMECLSQLDSDRYKTTIIRNFDEKAGVLSPFVFWTVLSGELLNLALACIPASHLKKFFERIMLDIKSNRSGLPDLIQFWPQERRYLMIEVKAPGDRLQDNQIRWIDYCAAHAIPVAVCHVEWVEHSN